MTDSFNMRGAIFREAIDGEPDEDGRMWLGLFLEE
jgi:hypothetical protein